MKNRFFLLRLILISFILFLVGSAESLSQQGGTVLINGKVLDEETGAPLENANVFLSGTTIGTTTGINGKFILNNIPFGSYDIIFSFMGFETEKRNFSSYKPKAFDFDISLKRKTIVLNQINITGTVPEDWKKNLETFTKVFIGETNNAGEARILNPEVLDFIKDKKTNILKAFADSEIKIENKALGYMLYIILDSVVYVPDVKIKYMFEHRFRELTPASEEQKLAWESNRAKTYLKSRKRFYYALVHRQLKNDNYVLYEGDVKRLLNGGGVYIPYDKINLNCNRDSTIYTFNFTGGLRIENKFYYSGVLNFLYPSVLIDKFGNLLSSPYGVETYGYWSKQRIADLLPEDYVYTEK